MLGLKAETMQSYASAWGWVRKVQQCYLCGAAVPAMSNRGNKRRCDSCRATYVASKAKSRTPADRRRWREAQYARAGKVLLTREERWGTQRAESLRRQRPHVQLGRYRHYAEQPSTVDGARLILQALIRKLLVTRCDAEGVRLATIEYRARYANDPAFRAVQKAKTAGQKKKRGVLVSPDGSLTTEVIRRLFATTSMCPYCDRLMQSREKTLDHMEPVSRGGQHVLGNVTVCCHSCNSRKRSIPWARWMDRLPPHIAARFVVERAA